MTSYYDLVLALIPVVFGGVASVLTLAGMAFSYAVPIAATGAVLLMIHAMFIRSPIERSPTVDTTRPAVGDVHAD